MAPSPVPQARAVLVVNAGSSSIKLVLCDRQGRRL